MGLHMGLLVGLFRGFMWVGGLVLQAWGWEG